MMDETTQAKAGALPKESKQKPKKEKLKKSEFLYETFEEFCYVAVIVILVFMFIGRMATVVGDSMTETLQNGDRVIMTNLFYEPEQGDVVVIAKQSGYYQNDLIIKRIIAESGDIVHIDYDNWIVSVNGIILNEPYVKRIFGAMDREDMMIDTFTVPEGSYFVMGDNRNGSTDSRSNHVGFVKKGEILGHAIFRLYPFSDMGVIE